MLWIIGLFLTMLWIWGTMTHQTLQGYVSVLLILAMIAVGIEIFTHIREV
jgi:hypothetical protein